jgi:hypothetical protein
MLRQKLSEIFEILKPKGISPYRVALDCGIDPSLLKKALDGRQGFSDAVLERLAESKDLGISIQELKAWKILDEYSLDELKFAISEAVGAEQAEKEFELAKKQISEEQ